MVRIAARALGAVLVSVACFAANGAMAADESYVAECVEQLVRETPGWGAMKTFRAQMLKNGFSVTGAVRESDPKNGKSWTAYNVRIKGEDRAYRVACMDRR